MGSVFRTRDVLVSQRVWYAANDYATLFSSAIHTYTMAQQPLKSFGPSLMRVSLSDSILVTVHLFSTKGGVMGDKSR
jgi:hypothetical protein